jgi:hypothetical protein
VIEKLLQTPFSSLSYDDKLKIIEEGAPKPNVNLQIKIKTCTWLFNTVYMRLFHGCVGVINYTNCSVDPVSYFLKKNM